METELYNQTGFGYAFTPSSGEQRRGSFGRLVLTDEGITFTLAPGVNDHFQYSQVSKVEILRDGFISLSVTDHDAVYSFSGNELDKIIGILRDHNVLIAPNEINKIGVAKGVQTFNKVFAVGFLAVWIGLLILFLFMAHIL